ncbi:cysteine desulfurase DndA [Candidatus Pelagibacter sp. HIMB1506]|uniref:cysteine desulfurase DndA n=1 Tax=Candidatus Pelagibacter sp. HIMB1506 TaxID=3413337 RepID=UPI003F843103
MSIYLDCNATTPIEPEVVEKMNNYLTTDFGNEGSHTHSFGSIAKKAVHEATDHVVSLVNASRNEIIFTSGATESNNLSIFGLKDYGLKNNKKHIITSAIEHKAVLEPIQELEKVGFEVDIINVDKSGRVNQKDIKDKLREDTLLISIMGVNNETGVIQPINEIIEIIKDHDCYFHVDAAQMYGKDIDTLSNKRIDLISISGHKVFGPKGIGALVTRLRNFNKPPLQPLFFGGGQQAKLRPGTLPVHLIVGLGVAAKIAKKNLKKRQEQNKKIYNQIIKLMKSLNGNLNGDEKYLLGNCINFSVPNVDAEAFMLTTKDLISVSNGSACTSSTYEPSHVIKAMTDDENRLKGAIRISWCHLTNEKLPIDDIFSRVKNII